MTDQPVQTAPEGTRPEDRQGRGSAQARYFASVALPYVVVLALYLAGGALIPGFTSIQSVRAILALSTFLGIAAVGQTLAIMLGGIDLSIPALITLGNVFTIYLYGLGWPFALVIAVVLAAACLAGLVNGWLSQTLRTHSLIITLATGAIIGGIVLVVAKDASIGNVPTWLTTIVSPGQKTFGIEMPPIVLVWAAILVLIVLMQRFTTLGRRIYATGANPLAADLALVRVRRVWIAVYVVSAVAAAITGILLAGYASGADQNIGDQYLFSTVAAVVVGGTSLLGGSGGYGRTVVGAIAITLLSTILLGKGYSDNVQQILLGVLIVLLVMAYGRERHIREQV